VTGGVLVANRGEIAVRVIRACRDLQLRSVAVHSAVDADALHVQLADEAVCIGPASASKSYLSIDAILAAAQSTGVAAIHPGYGFLSENPSFAREVEAAGLIWIGPPADVIDAMGDKAAAREAATRANVPLVPGTGILPSPEAAVAAASELGYPVLIKAAAGGGGKGIKLVDNDAELLAAFGEAQREVAAAFGDSSLYLEKALQGVRHIEVQLLADQHGNVIHLFERDCSLQRNRQKLVEEAPAPTLSRSSVAQICDAAVRLAASVNYQSAGTVEFLVDREGNYYFIEMNTRVQVEHGVTEMLTGVDIVQQQIDIAFGRPLTISQEEVTVSGAVIELRINAEDPDQDFRGSPGEITQFRMPGGPGVRVDSGVEAGLTVQPFYDSMVAKLLVSGADRQMAIRRALRALEEVRIGGITTTGPFLSRLLTQDWFASADFDTTSVERFLARHDAENHAPKHPEVAKR
jgi:acetyl-CoA carboxylase biotin carboxylase subunit